jgi:hypothetical protein
MPVCEGLPDGPCPQRRNDKHVTIGKGDLLLCQSCDAERRRLFDLTKKTDDAAKQTRSMKNAAAPISSTSTESASSVVPKDGLAASSSRSMKNVAAPNSSTSTESAASATPKDGRAASTSTSTSSLPTTTGTTTTVNELLTYAVYYRDKSTVADLHKLIIGFYLPSEIADAKKMLLNAFPTELTDCQFKTARRHSTARSAHDAEVEDILNILELLDNGNVLDRYQFAAMSLDRLPKYGPNEINVCAVVDRQLIVAQELAELKDRFNILTTDSASVSTITTELIGDQLKPVSDKIQDQLNQFISTCNTLNETLKSLENTQTKATGSVPTNAPLIDRSMNIVLTGIAENRNATVWRDIVAQALNHAAGVKIDIVDAFRLGRYTEGKKRPVLVKLNSVWNRRLVIAGARKLRDITELSRVFISADEALDVRRRNTLDRLKYRAQRERKTVRISSDGVLSIDGVDTFSLQCGFISSQSSIIINLDGQ